MGCYTVRLDVLGGEGCAAFTTAEVCVEDAFLLFAPNAFTPNGDGINEAFGVITSVRTAEEFELLVFDRWGRVVHTADAPERTWDGEGYPQGVYAWRLRMRDTLGAVAGAQRPRDLGALNAKKPAPGSGSGLRVRAVAP